ncbi:MAG: hypothetical protein E7559_05615 [Ruminococcaceae bacterium]|nr:hypothetical protein [Oscillospiraceae bacterium]
MSLFNCGNGNNCGCRCSCTTAALIAGVILGLVTALLQITAVITVAPAFLWVALGIAVVYLLLLAVAAVVAPERTCRPCLCPAIGTLLAGALGSALFAVVLLGVGIVATSVVSAILLGLLLFFLTLLLGGTACLIRCLFGCDD